MQDFKDRVARAQVWSYQNPDSFSATLARIIGIPEEAAKLQFVRRATRWVSIDEQVVADQQHTDLHQGRPAQAAPAGQQHLRCRLQEQGVKPHPFNESETP